MIGCKYNSYGLLSRTDMNTLIAIADMKIGEFFSYIALNQGTLSLIAKGEKKFTEGNIRLLIKVFGDLENRIYELNRIITLALDKDYYPFQEAVANSDLQILDKKIPTATTKVTIRSFVTGPTWFCKKVNKYQEFLKNLQQTCRNYPGIMHNLTVALEEMNETGDYTV